MSAARFHDIIAWEALVAPGVIACKDGGLVCAWQVRGIDTGRMPLDVQQAERGTLARAFGTLEGGETLWTVWQRRPWTPRPLLSAGGDAVLDTLAAETNAIFARPGLLWQDSFTLWLRVAPARGPLAPALEAFERRRRHIEGWIDPVLGLARVDAEGVSADPPAAIIGLLADLVGTPRSAPRLAGLPIALDALIAPALYQPRLTGPLISSGHPLAVLSLTGERERYGPAPLEPLQNLAAPFTWVTRYSAYSLGEARATLGWIRKLRRQSAADLMANVEGSGTGERNLYSERLLAESDVTREAIERGDTGYGRYISTLILRGDGEAGGLAGRRQALVEALQTTGFGLREERAGAVATWLASLPGHDHPLPREVMVPAAVMSDCMPVRGLDTPHRPSPLLPPETPPLLPAVTFAGTLHPFNLHVGDVGHTLVFGPTGTGKSVLLGHLVTAWLRYPGARVIAFDRGRSLRYATAALGGLWLEPGPASAGAGVDAIAPLSHIARLGNGWALDWVSEMLRRGLGRAPGQGSTPEETRELGRALVHLAASPQPTLQGLRDMVQDKAVRAVLDSWISGPRAGTFDQTRARNVGAALAGARLTVFETEPLIDAHEDITVLALDYIFAEVQAQFDGRPTLIVIDEAWKLLEHDLCAARLRSWLREGRKRNVALLMATQSVSDAATARVTADLVESCPTRVYLANSAADTSTQAPHYTALGLDADQRAVVAMLRRKAQMMLVQDGCARVLSLPLGPAHLSILGRTGATDSARIAALARVGDGAGDGADADAGGAVWQRDLAGVAEPRDSPDPLTQDAIQDSGQDSAEEAGQNTGQNTGQDTGRETGEVSGGTDAPAEAAE